MKLLTMTEPKKENKETTELQNIKVWEDTRSFFDKVNQDITRSVKYTKLQVYPEKKFFKTQIVIVKADAIDVAIGMREKNYYPMLLNMADPVHPGGKVDDGVFGNEESCFRRSDYYKHLLKSFYPLKDTEVIYSKNVQFVKTNEEAGCEWKPPRCMDMIACPPPPTPEVEQTEKGLRYKSQEHADLMKEKIRMIFKVGVLHNHDVIVVSDFGCSQGHPPEHVAELFHEVINEFKGSFILVIFGIKEETCKVFMDELKVEDPEGDVQRAREAEEAKKKEEEKTKETEVTKETTVSEKETEETNQNS